MSNKTKKQSKMLALVKWVGGPDDGQFTVGIDINHIKNFHYKTFMDDEVDPLKVYVVEWRDTIKEPLGGWTCFNARVLAVSSSMSLLNKRLQVVGGSESPRRVSRSGEPSDQIQSSDDRDTDHSSVDITDSEEQQLMQSGARKDTNSALGKNSSKGDTAPGSDDATIDNASEIFDSAEPQRKKSKLGTGKNKNSTLDKTNWKSDTGSGSAGVFMTKHSNQGGNSSTAVQKTVDLTNEPASTSEYVTKTAFAKALQDVMNCFKVSNDHMKEFIAQKINNDSQNCPSNSNATRKSSKENMMEIGMEGSGIMIRKDMWLSLKQKKSFQVMGCALVFELFSKDVLLRSNYKGGAAKNKKGADSPRYAPLDKKIMDAIRYTVSKQWPSTYKESLLGAAINTALSKLRKNSVTDPLPAEQVINQEKDTSDEED